MKQAWLALLILMAMSLLSGCAEIGAPPGGPEDKTPPHILSTYPGQGATSVIPDNVITINFTERIIKPAVNAVYISPRPDVPPNISWKADRVIVKLAEPFAEDQTYLVTIGAELKDQRNNPLDSSFTLAFTTGDSLDYGEISGQVLDSNFKAAPNVTVALYDKNRLEGHPLDSLYPDYLTSTNNLGEFNFTYLPDKLFYLIAFVDRNRNERINAASELIGLPERTLVWDSLGRIEETRLHLTRDDSSALKITNGRVTADKIMELSLNKPMIIESLPSALKRFTLRSLNEPYPEFTFMSFLEQSDRSTDRLHAYVGNLDTGYYAVTLTLDSTNAVLLYDSLRVSARDDITAPRLISQPDEQTPFPAEELDLIFTFSEPIDSTLLSTEDWLLMDKDSIQIPLSLRYISPFSLKLQPYKITNGESYQLLMTETSIADYAGNVYGDSISTFSFTTLDPDSVGSVSGQINQPTDGEYLTVLRFRHIKTSHVYYVYEKERDFVLELPGGTYLLDGYLDVNNDSMYTAGSYYYDRMSEKYITYTDTIKVRPRFITEGINIIF